MLKILQGDIFKADVEAIVNPCNTVDVAGAGLSLLFKQKYPDNYKEYVKACKSKELYVGRLFIYEPKDDKFKYIINFPTKTDWRKNSKLEDIKIGLGVLIKKIDQLNIKSIAIPALGVGNGKLQWEDVMSLMIGELYCMFESNKIAIYIYRPL